MENEIDTPLDRAVAILGSQGKLAEVIGVKQQTISFWRTNDKPIPAEHVPAIARATGISRAELRPDLFAPEAAE